MPGAHIHYRAVVAGAGPAGVMAAVEAASSGPVLLVERSTMPRRKSCGGMLNPAAMGALSRLGRVPRRLVLDPEAVRFRYVDWEHRAYRPTRLGFTNVDRRGFDEWLVSALPETVEVLAGTSVVDFRDVGGRLRVDLAADGDAFSVSAEYLVGADGARSAVRRQLGWDRTDAYVTVQDILALDAPLEAWFDCIRVRCVGDSLAYAYVVPKGDVAIVGSVFYPHTKRPGDLHERVVAVIRERSPQLGEHVRREGGAALHVRRRRDLALGSGRVLLCGEAAGFISPSSGEGISYALRTGGRAGLAVARADNGDALSRYARLTRPVTDEIRGKLRWLPVLESGLATHLVRVMPSELLDGVTRRL